MDEYEAALLWLLDVAPIYHPELSETELQFFFDEYMDWYQVVQETLDDLYEAPEDEEPASL